MGLTTIFGINGVGKDTIAEGLRKKHPEIRITSLSRMLMYSLGISKSCDVREKISEEQYKMLEQTPQSIIVNVENNYYKHLLERMANSDEKVIVLSHLVSALRLGGTTKYLTDKVTPEWYIELNDNLIQLVAPLDLISERRKLDITRKREIDIAQIFEHQELCSREWQRIERFYPNKRDAMHTIQNIDLNKAIKEIEEIIYGRNKDIENKQQRNSFIESLRYESSHEDTDRIGIPLRSKPIITENEFLNKNKKEGEHDEHNR